MAKHPTSSRVHREDHGPDDAFVSTIKRAYAWGRQNTVVLTILGVVVLVAVIGTIWFTAQQRQLESQATARFNQVQQTVASGNTQLAIRDLQTYLERFGGTRAAGQARLLLGSILLSEDRAQEGIEALGDLPDDLEEPFGLAAARLKAAAYEESGELDQAVEIYQRIAADARFQYQRREALADAARIRLDNGEADRAAHLYDEVLQTFEEDEAGRAYYTMWHAEAKARARSGVASAPAGEETSDAVSLDAASDTASPDSAAGAPDGN